MIRQAQALRPSALSPEASQRILCVIPSQMELQMARFGAGGP